MANNENILTFSSISREDGPELIDIFNQYIQDSDAAFPEHPVPTAFFEMMRPILDTHPSVSVRDPAGLLIGFGMLKPHNPMPVFSHCREITYFVRPEWTGRGIGSDMLTYLTDKARAAGITCILAEISGKNEGSIKFHQKSGFRECGRFSRVGKRKGEFFDTVWMQKEI
ncbi:MAG TPA: GNAT family N-acetyltransferase [Methanospirillum sp.]|nr:GNAT family N-acetyltransferase [Methanospirillum sp.]